MPPRPLYDISNIDSADVAIDRNGIYEVNPHRYEFQLLDGLYFVNQQTGIIAGFRNVRDDEFWVRGHIPGRPIFPGVLMIEAAAQLVGYYVMTVAPDKGFLGFGGVDNVKFRGVVLPGQRVIMVGKMMSIRSRRCIGHTQGFVDGRMVYEGRITGVWM